MGRDLLVVDIFVIVPLYHCHACPAPPVYTSILIPLAKYFNALFSGTYPLKIRSIRQHVGGLKHPLNGYFVVFLGLVPWSDFPSVH